MRAAACVVALVFLIFAAALAFPPRRDLMTTIDIAASPTCVWSVLTDTAAYPAWNPDMLLKGALVPGRIIEYDQGQGEDRIAFHPAVVAAAAPHDLAWRGQVVTARFLGVLHYFHLQPAGEHTLFTQGEHLRGVLLWVWNADRLLPGFQAMNARLRTRAEQCFPSGAVPTTSPP